MGLADIMGFINVWSIKMIYKDVKENSEINYLDNDRFLDETDYQSLIGTLYSSDFEVARAINQYMYELYDLITVHNEDTISRFIISSFNKVHKSFQAVVLCCTRGLEEQAKILVRTILDKTMIATAVIKCPDNYNKWVEMQLNERNRLIKAINNKAPGLEHLNIDENIQIDERGKRITQKDWADMAGMTADYNFIYRLFSGEVHLSAASIDWDYGLDDDERYMSIAPRIEETNLIILTLADYMMRFIKQILKYFDIENTRYLEIDIKLEDCQKKCLNNTIYVSK